MIEFEEIRQQFKVFLDPTFDQFTKIVRANDREFQESLPLFAQLFVLREISQFFQMQ
jgi:hypothetical protein